MSIAAPAYYPPVARKEGLERLDLAPKGASDLWSEVHDEVQAQLAGLESEVRDKLPAAQVRSGRTSGERFFLFSYRTFSLPESEIDPVVAGVCFTQAGPGIAVEADISGEHTGDVILSAPGKTVPNSPDELLAAARGAARKLCQTTEPIVAALSDPSRGDE
jgi:hypothetical protein